MAEGKHRDAPGLAVVSVLSALALGAVVSLLASRVQPGPWPALVAATGMVLALRFSAARRGPYAVVLAVLGTLLALFYGETLELALRIGAQFGLSLPEVVRTSGAAALAGLSWRLLPGTRAMVYLAAALFAGAMAWYALPRAHAERR